MDTCEYEKNRQVTHKRYSTNIGTDTGQIFIQRVMYEGAITRILPVPLTSLDKTTLPMHSQSKKMSCR